MCTAWCSWQALNNVRRDPEVVRREVIRARMHPDFMTGIYVLHELLKNEHDVPRLSNRLQPPQLP